MMPALHQDLRSAKRSRLLNLLIDLIEGDDIGIVVLFDAIKRAELAIDIADIRVIDVPINDVGDDIVTSSIISLCLGELPSSVSQGSQFFQRQSIKPQRLGFVHS